MKFKCTTGSCTAAFCEKGELLAHQTNHGEQKRITCNYCNHKLSENITELTRQRFFRMFGEDYCNDLYFVILTGSHFLHKNIFVKRNIHCYLNKLYEINSLYLYYQFANNYNYSHLIQRKMGKRLFSDKRL
jgi:hypothetical protein